MNNHLATGSYAGRYLIVYWSAKANSNRTATITWTVKAEGGNAGVYYMAGPVRLWMNGTQRLNRTDRFQLWQNTTVGKGTYTVPYNTAGNATVTAYLEGAIYSSSVNVTGKETHWNLPNIGGAPTSVTSFQNTEKTATTASFSWITAHAADRVEYSLDGGAWTQVWTGNATVGNFTVSNLTHDKQYSIRIRVRRRDSGATATSSSISFMLVKPKPPEPEPDPEPTYGKLWQITTDAKTELKNKTIKIIE